jgi:hypothetical protein
MFVLGLDFSDEIQYCGQVLPGKVADWQKQTPGKGIKYLR